MFLVSNLYILFTSMVLLKVYSWHWVFFRVDKHFIKQKKNNVQCTYRYIYKNNVYIHVCTLNAYKV